MDGLKRWKRNKEKEKGCGLRKSKGRVKGKEKERGIQKWISFFLIVSLLSGIIGCGERENLQEETHNRVENTTNKDDADGELADAEYARAEKKDAEEKVMGRYLESMNGEMADFAQAGSRIARQEDGSLILFSPDSGKWVSKDDGVTWEPEALAWFSRLKAENAYIMDIAVAMDGSVGVIYCEAGEGEQGESEDGHQGRKGDNAEDGLENGKREEKNETGSKEREEEDETASKEREGKDETASRETEGSGAIEKPDGKGADAKEAQEELAEPPLEGGSGERGAVHPVYKVFSKEGDGVEFEIPPEEDGWMNHMNFSEDGKIYGTALNGKIYEIDWKQGSQRVVAQTEIMAYHVEIWGGRLVCSSSSGLDILDVETGETVEDQALDDFLETQMGKDMVYAQTGTQPLLVIPAGEDILYLLCEKGIFRHVLGGNVVEQVADGALNSLSNPAFSLGDGIMQGEDGFLLLFANGQLGSYVYHPDIPAVPDIMLRAYSLRENEKLKMAIAVFQAKHPEAYVRYDIGLDGNTSATREDALKKLNIEIAAGDGPDLFLLDDMPLASYMEKGILADLSPFLEKAGEGCFPNILRAFEAEGKVLAAPMEFLLPIAGGKKEDVEKLKDLPSFVQAVRQYREEKPQGSILGWVREVDLLRQFLWVCAPAWTEDNGSLDEDRLEEFFTHMSDLWEAEKEGISEKMRSEVDEFYLRMERQGNTAEELEKYRINHIGWTGDQYMSGKQEFFLGGISCASELDMTVSYFHIDGKEDGDFAAYGGQVQDVFIPQSIVGISAASRQQEMAAELMEILLETSYWSGLSLKEEQLREDLRANATKDGVSYASAGGAEMDGTYVILEIYPASEEEADRLVQMAASAKEPYVRNRILEEAVCAVGEKVLKGEMDAREGVQEVKQRVALSMAE